MIKLITLLVSLSIINSIQSNPVPEDASVDWSTRISDNVESIIGPTKFNFDDSSEEVDSTFAKREASPVSGPLDAPLGWGARIESSPSASINVDVSPSSSSSGAVVAGGGGGSSVGVGGGDNKQKVDWALNPGDNKRLYSTNESPEVIEQKKEETLPLAPESSKPSEESNPDPYKNILPAVLTGKRRLVEGDKPVQSSSSSSSSGTNEGDLKSSVTDSKEKVTTVSPLVESKGQATGQVLPYDGPYPLKPSDGKSIPQHVYTEDQFPSVITIKGREYLVIPHKSNSVQPSAAQTSVASSWYTIPGPTQQGGSFAQTGHFGSPFFGSSGASAYQQAQAGQVSKSNQTAPSVTPSIVTEVPSSGHHQFVQPFVYPSQSSYPFGPSFPQHPAPSAITWSGRYPVYHSSVFTNPNVQQSGPVSQSSERPSENSIPSVFASFFPQYGPYPSSGVKKFEFFTPPTHTVTVSSIGGPSTTQGDKTAVMASPPSFIAPSDQSVGVSAGEFKGNPNLVPDPSFSPKLQEPVHSPSPIVGGDWSKGGAVNTQHESFVTKPLTPESNLHAPPQIPTWMPTGFSVVAGGHPVQAPSVSSSPPASVPTSSSKTHVESPVTVTVDTKFPPAQSPSSSSSPGNSEVKGASTTWTLESSSPSISVGSFNVDSAAGQPVAKGQLLPQQQDQQQVGVAGELVVPTTIVDAKNQFVPSSSEYFASSPSVNQVPSSMYPSSAILSSSSGHVPGQRQFMVNSWQSSGYGNHPILASAPSPHYESTPSWDLPFYHQQGIVYNQGLDHPDFDLNQIPPTKMFRPTAFAN